MKAAVNSAPATEVLQRIREQAGQRFAQLGWPTTHLEEWQYTNLQPLQSRFEAGAFREAPCRTGFPACPEEDRLESLSYTGGTLRGALAELVFVNGVYAPEASTFAGSSVPRVPRGSSGRAVPETEEPEEPRNRGLRIWTLREAPLEILEQHFARYADYANHAMTALNTANAEDGAVVEVTGVVEGFVHLLFVGSAGFQSYPRNLVIAGRGAQIAVVETYAGSGSYFTNAVTEIVAGDGAVVDHYKLESESLEAFHIGTVHVHQERASSVTSRSISIGGGVVRNDVSVSLAGEGASLVLDGLFITAGTQHVDNHTLIDHVVPHCDSIELYKGVLDGNSRGIFDGRIIVRPDAQKTVSRQNNKNLLLSDTAIVDSKPTLEISNDDVKCNHGSTIGQLEEEPLFYLRSRGIGESEARDMLVYAFASEIVDRMKLEPVREQIRRAMSRQMPRGGEQR